MKAAGLQSLQNVFHLLCSCKQQLWAITKDSSYNLDRLVYSFFKNNYDIIVLKLSKHIQQKRKSVDHLCIPL